MNVLPWFVLFAGIHGTVTMELFDSSLMESLVKKMIGYKLFDPVTTTVSYKPCSGSRGAAAFFECYKHMRSTYVGRFQKNILHVFLERINELTKRYNSLVSSLTAQIKGSSDDGIATKRLLNRAISTITFKDSKLNCIIGFIDMFNDKHLPVNNLIADYVFFHQFSSHLAGNATKDRFIHLVDNYFTYQNNDTIQTDNGFLAELIKVKFNINYYSKPFCEIRDDFNLTWKDGEAWMWTALQQSVLLPSIMMDGQNIYDYKGLSGGKTLDTSIKSITTFNRARTTIDHFEIIKSMLNKYVTKVLIRKAIYVVTNAMQLYYNNVHDLDYMEPQGEIEFKEYHSTLSYLIQLVRSFQVSLGLYLTSSFWLNTIHIEENTVMINAVAKLVEKLMYLARRRNTSPDDPKPEIDEINTLLNNETYWTLIPNSDDKKPIDHYSELKETKPQMDNLIIEMEKINIAISYLVEVIKPF